MPSIHDLFYDLFYLCAFFNIFFVSFIFIAKITKI